MKPALWKNTKKPTGNYCDRHKEVLEKLLKHKVVLGVEGFSGNWVLLGDREKSLCLCAESNSRMRKEKQMENNAAENTDKEIWRKVKDDYQSPSIHVTESGSIGIDVGSLVFVAPVEKWHEVFKKNLELEGIERQKLDNLIDKIANRIEERNQENSILKC